VKILYINNFFTNFGGAEKVMMDEATLMEENGHQVFFFATDRKPYYDENYEYINYFPKFIDYYTLSRVNSLKELPGIFYNFEAKKNLSLLLNIIQPDIVHVHSVYYHLTPSVLEACFEKNIPVVMTVHDVRLICPSGRLLINDEEYCTDELCLTGSPYHCLIHKCKDKSISRSGLVMTEFIFRKFHSLYDKVSLFICPCMAMQKLLVKSGFPDNRLKVLHNFLDNHSLKVIPDYKHNGYFLYSGRLAKYKGVGLLLEAMKNLPNVHLRIAGTGEDEKHFRNLSSDLKLNNVVFLGFLTGEELANEYNNALAIIQPSLWFENFPITVLESFARGKPVIASDVGGLPEMVEHGVSGLIYQSDNKKMLIEAILKLHNNHELAIKMGYNARTLAEKLYQPEKHFIELSKLYASLLDIS
jgi:glycosyltransferase involved in cell wall biosynthesis